MNIAPTNDQLETLLSLAMFQPASDKARMCLAWEYVESQIIAATQKQSNSEFICRKCGLRTDSKHSSVPEF